MHVFRQFLAALLCLLVAIPAYSCTNDQLATDTYDADGNTTASNGNGYVTTYFDHREYEEFPRGRVAYDTKSGKFVLLADRSILNRNGIVRNILSRMNLRPKGTESGTDSH
jgi:hypothetical protein